MLRNKVAKPQYRFLVRVHIGRSGCLTQNKSEEMTRRTKQTTKRITCEYFNWLLRRRGNVFQADGRSNRSSAGRHSVDARSEEEAIQNLRQLDRVQAVKLGLADKSILTDSSPGLLLLADGEKRYLDHCRRPAVVGGPKPVTPKRYRPILTKAIAHFRELGLTAWNEVTKQHLESYAAWLDGEGYAYATEFIEITTLKQLHGFFIREELLPATNRIVMPMRKPTHTDTYCYKVPEVNAMLSHCRSDKKLRWMREVILALSTTGMRISELASLNWDAVDLEKKLITLKDERCSRIARRRAVRTTKSGQDRTFPIHEHLLQLLVTKAESQKSEKVFEAAKGGPLRARNVLELLIKRVIDPLSEQFYSPQSEFGFKDGRLHSFRHFFCSECANRGVPEQMVMKWMGHQTSGMVRRYYHANDVEAQKQIKKLDFLDGLSAM
jgi:integrase